MSDNSISCSVCYSILYVTKEEKENPYSIGFISCGEDVNICQLCKKRIKDRYSIQNDTAAAQLVHDFGCYDIRHALGLS